jgi:hypothetical protein
MGPVSGNLDTTISLSEQWRVQTRDQNLVGIANGGTRYSTNGDDGNLNYNKGITSRLGKVVHELDAKWGRFGAFTRVNYWYDMVNSDTDRVRAPLSDPAKDLVGKDFQVLDAYGTASFSVLGRPVDFRFGRQVISWGESTFIPGGLNALNPVNVNRIRQPGVEVRDALLPVEQAYLSVGLLDNLSLEGTYQLFWHSTDIDPPGSTDIDPPGSFFSTNDFAGASGSKVVLGYGRTAETTATSFVPRDRDIIARDHGQYGVALRYYSEFLGTEFGAYHMKIHSKLPMLSAKAHSAFTSVPLQIPTITSARYFLEYPEDIKIYGLSFNSEIPTTGIAVQGEYSYYENKPLQIDDVELLYAGLRLYNTNQLAAGAIGAVTTSGLVSQLRRYSPGETIQGYRRHPTSQFQTTVTKLFGPMLGASQWVMLGEAGVYKVHGMPSKSQLRYEGPGTDLPGDGNVAAAQGVPGQGGGFADDFSWGYRMLTRWDFANVIGAVNMSPRLVYNHDVSGVSPGPGGPFIQGRKAVTVGLSSTYLQRVNVDLSYTNYFGGGPANLIHDRDFAAVTFRYAI